MCSVIIFKKIFDYFTSLVNTISISDNLGTFPLDFLLGYSQYLGIYPEDGEGNEFVKMLSAEDKGLILSALEDSSALNRLQRRKAINILLKYYQYFLQTLSSYQKAHHQALFLHLHEHP